MPFYEYKEDRFRELLARTSALLTPMLDGILEDCDETEEVEALVNEIDVALMPERDDDKGDE